MTLLTLYLLCPGNALISGFYIIAGINQKAATEAAHLRMMSTVVTGFFRHMDRRIEEMKPKY